MNSSDAAHAMLTSLLGPDEHEMAFGRAEAREGSWGLLTERRLLWGSSWLPSRVGTLDVATVTSFQEVERLHRWGVLLRHADVLQRVHVPAHRVLWWSWGNAERPVGFTETEFRFSRRDTALARALRDSLAAFEVPTESTRKVSMPPRSDRIGTVIPYRVERPTLYRWRRRARDIYEELYGGHHLFWRSRLLGWALFCLPLFLIAPWLGPAGVALFELLVIGLTQLSLYRERRRV